jgi:hypothetical protein
MPPFRGAERTGADEAVAYRTRKAPYLDYATAQIATGIIEGAARFLIKDRLDITARGGLPPALKPSYEAVGPSPGRGGGCVAGPVGRRGGRCWRAV